MADLQMPTLHFMPWCRLDREYRVGPVALIPFHRDQPPASFSPETVQVITAILTDFMGIDNHPVDECTVVGLQRQALAGGSFSPTVFATIHDYVQIACLSSLEGRDYLGHAEPHSNSECFALYARQYHEGQPVAAPILRRDSTPTGLAGAALRVHIPVQTVVVPRPPFSEPPYHALADVRSRLLEEGARDGTSAIDDGQRVGRLLTSRYDAS